VLRSAFKGLGCGNRGALTQAFRRAGCLSSEGVDGGTFLFPRFCSFNRSVDPGTEQTSKCVQPPRSGVTSRGLLAIPVGVGQLLSLVDGDDGNGSDGGGEDSCVESPCIKGVSGHIGPSLLRRLR
jgi:hypothetical protein